MREDISYRVESYLGDLHQSNGFDRFQLRRVVVCIVREKILNVAIWKTADEVDQKPAPQVMLRDSAWAVFPEPICIVIAGTEI
eukprot:COSAG02_NODE_9042_length_2353_cov_1.321207_3_plen_83_part_00